MYDKWRRESFKGRYGENFRRNEEVSKRRVEQQQAPLARLE
jgi:hypothetical protein